MDDNRDWSIDHPVLSVVLTTVAFGVVSVVYGEWIRATILGILGGVTAYFEGRSERAARERGGLTEVRRLRERRRALGLVLLVVLVLAILVPPLVA